MPIRHHTRTCIHFSTRIISTADSSGVMLLQAAAREASARGAVGERDDGAIKRAYNKLEKLVPGLLNKAGST